MATDKDKYATRCPHCKKVIGFSDMIEKARQDGRNEIIKEEIISDFDYTEHSSQWLEETIDKLAGDALK